MFAREMGPQMFLLLETVPTLGTGKGPLVGVSAQVPMVFGPIVDNFRTKGARETPAVKLLFFGEDIATHLVKRGPPSIRYLEEHIYTFQILEPQ